MRGLALRFTSVGLIVAASVLAWASGALGKPPAPPPPPPPPPPTFRYDVEFLGNLPGGTGSTATAINEFSEVVGVSSTTVVLPWATVVHGDRAYVWSPDGGMEDVSALIDPQERCLFKTARDVNNAGQITGYGYFDANQNGMIDSQEGPGKAVRFSPGEDGGFGSVEELLAVPSSGTSEGKAINSSGDVAGNAFDGGVWRVFVYTDETGAVDLGFHSGGPLLVEGMTDRDANGRVTIVGTVNSSSIGAYRGWKMTWRAGEAPTLSFIAPLFSDRRTVGHTSARAINAQGIIAGMTQTNRSDVFAGRYGTSWMNLGTLADSTSWNDSEAFAINGSNLTVGLFMTGDVNDNPNERAFIHSDTFKMWDLASLVDNLAAGDSGLLGEPNDINDQKVVCGSGEAGAYVLIPKPAP